MIGLKMLQDRFGVLMFWPDVRERWEKSLGRKTTKIKSVKTVVNRHNLYLVLHFVLLKLRSVVIFFQKMIDRRLLRIVNLIKGRHVPDRGKASHFLSDIASFKDKYKND